MGQVCARRAHHRMCWGGWPSDGQRRRRTAARATHGTVLRTCVAVQVERVRDAMTAETNKALVGRLLERVRGGWTPDVIEEFFAPGYRRYLNPTTPPLTREGQRDRANRLRTAFPDGFAMLEDMLAEGDRVAYINGIPRIRPNRSGGRRIVLDQFGPAGRAYRCCVEGDDSNSISSSAKRSHGGIHHYPCRHLQEARDPAPIRHLRAVATGRERGDTRPRHILGERCGCLGSGRCGVLGRLSESIEMRPRRRTTDRREQLPSLHRQLLGHAREAEQHPSKPPKPASPAAPGLRWCLGMRSSRSRSTFHVI